MQTTDAIRKRCSLKTHLSSRPVDAEDVQAVLHAATLAPSARNTQPWRFVVVQGKEAVDSLVDAAFSEKSAVIREAPVIIVACSRPADGATVEGREYYLYDLGSAVQNLLLAATDRGLVTHLIASFDEDALKRELRIPEDVRAVVATPLAHPSTASYDEAAEERLRERSRMDVSELTFHDVWGKRIGHM